MKGKSAKLLLVIMSSLLSLTLIVPVLAQEGGGNQMSMQAPAETEAPAPGDAAGTAGTESRMSMEPSVEPSVSVSGDIAASLAESAISQLAGTQLTREETSALFDAVADTVVSASWAPEGVAEVEVVSITGWFKDRHCRPKEAGVVLDGSCSVACGTGGPTGQAMLRGCQSDGHGIYINPTDANPDGEFIVFDLISSELLRAFLLQLEEVSGDASGGLSLEATGYYVDVPTNADESKAPYQDGPADHYVKGFHATSVRGVVIGDTSYQGFADNDYTLAADALSPKDIAIETNDGVVTVSFTPPAGASAPSPKYGVKQYKIAVIENGEPISVVIAHNDSSNPLTSASFPAPGDGDYSYEVTALYTASLVSSDNNAAQVVVTDLQ
ncbi:MAG: hypothetical protein LBB86_03665 [Oscillospiraceae bacterium]|jgi:hypothetical protein|nr:hypothetical protein [Oscillospiraceae bacterium]